MIWIAKKPPASRRFEYTLVDLKGAYSNINLQVRQLESLLRQLPDLSEPFQYTPRLPAPRAARQLEPERAAALVAEYEAGATVYELATQFKVHRQTVSRILKDAGVTLRYRRLSPDQIQEAVRLYESGWSLARIAERFKVDPSTIHVRLRKLGVRMRDCQGRER